MKNMAIVDNMQQIVNDIAFLDVQLAKLSEVVAEKEACKRNLQRRFAKVFFEKHYDAACALRAEFFSRQQILDSRLTALADSAKNLSVLYEKHELSKRKYEEQLYLLKARKNYLVQELNRFKESEVKKLAEGNELAVPLLEEFISQKPCDPDNQDCWGFSDIFNYRYDVLVHPERYTRPLSTLRAGGIGGLMTGPILTIGVLARCWQLPEFNVQCPDCKGVMPLVDMVGSLGSGGYHRATAYCPTCDKEHVLDASSARCLINHGWRHMFQRVKEVRDSLLAC